MLVRRGLDQLRRDTDLVAGAQHGAFYYGIHVQLASDLRQRLVRSFVYDYGGTEDYP